MTSVANVAARSASTSSKPSSAPPMTRRVAAGVLTSEKGSRSALPVEAVQPPRPDSPSPLPSPQREIRERLWFATSAVL